MSFLLPKTTATFWVCQCIFWITAVVERTRAFSLHTQPGYNIHERIRIQSPHHRHWRLQRASTKSTASKFTIPEDTKVDVLSEDPLVYVIPELLSSEECQKYMDRVTSLQEARPMTKSNPPEVSLEVFKLWPLSILSIMAGIPPFIRLQQQTPQPLAINVILAAILPPIFLVLGASFALAFAVILPLIRKISSESSRTSEAMAFNLEEDINFCRNLVERVSKYTGHPWYSWEAPVVTRYDPGAIFAKHGDASPNRGEEWMDIGGQRVVTCICYLNNVDNGGETSFDQLGIDVKPKQGHALVFFPADPASLRADPRTTHESLPPGEEKWIVQMFGRIEPRVPPPLGIPDSFGNIVK